jgi:hypothetical protein
MHETAGAFCRMFLLLCAACMHLLAPFAACSCSCVPHASNCWLLCAACMQLLVHLQLLWCPHIHCLEPLCSMDRQLQDSIKIGLQESPAGTTVQGPCQHTN